MRANTLWILLLGLLAGCSADSTAPGRDVVEARESTGSPQVRMLPVATAKTFAALPDRGELLADDPARTSFRAGAYTWRPIELSEAHALNSISGGKMEIRSPDGRTISLAYQRHVEHGDGNWTWIGRDDKGADAILTFGEKAAFGSIPDGIGGSLQLATSPRGAWLVTTDPSKFVPLHPRKPDYLVPPGVVQSAGARKHLQANMIAGQAPLAVTVVDLLVGYTPGFVTNLGGESQALTRLHNLVDTTNQAYANSGMSQQVRLVHSMPVSFVDATDNSDALSKLTGYQSGVGTIPVDPAFNALRAARDTYGADLVSLVRRFQTPENDSCGTAWLIGGGSVAIQPADQMFGYSVVSDGVDFDEGDGNTYFCRDETLAHELGHNMGQAHDQPDAASTGAHAYSYGYREASGTGFYTVMAYPAGASQFSIRYFANPLVLYQSRPTGVADASDNVRSMNLTMPIIAAFRATVVALPNAANDVDGNDKSDLLWWKPGNFGYSLMDGAHIASSRFFTLSSSYYVAATGDFNGDGKSDLLWTSAANDLYVWLSNGSAFTVVKVGSNYAAGWTIFPRAGDVNGDGKSDIIWSRPGQVGYSILNGAQIVSSSFFTVSAAYTLAATGDFDANGKLDLLFTSSARDLYQWRGNGTGFTVSRMGSTYAVGWSILKAGGDIDGDGKTDILWSRPGQFGYTLVDGTLLGTTRYFGVSATYSVATTGDFDSNGKLDLIWTSPANDLYAWMGNGTTFAAPNHFSNYAAGWTLVP